MQPHRADRPSTRGRLPVVLALLLGVTVGCAPRKPATPTTSSQPRRFVVTKVLGDNRMARPNRVQALVDAAVSADGTVVAVGFDDYRYDAEQESPDGGKRTVQVEKVDGMAWSATHSGRAWQRADVDVTLGLIAPRFYPRDFPTVQNMLGVAATPAGLIAVGFEAPNPRLNVGGVGIAVVWASQDGTAWRRVGDPGLKLRGLFSEGMRSVVTLGDLLVATGWTSEHGDADAAVWTSRDGQRWTRVNDPALTRPGDQLPNDLIAAGPGLVMVGDVGNTYPLDHQDRRPSQPAVWTSTDGQKWQLQTLPVPAATRTMSHRLVAVTHGGPGLVAVGLARDGERSLPIVWTSPDGRTWQPGGTPKLQGSTSLSLDSVVSTGSTLVAFGKSGPAAGSTGDLAAWTSTDARTWRPLPIPTKARGGNEVWAVGRARTLPDGRIIAVGGEGTDRVGHPAAWLVEPRP